MSFSLRDTAKSIVSRTGYRITNSNRRWGVDPLDDIARMIGGRAKVKCVFDVGANEGQSAMQFAKFFPNATVTSFEPVEKTFRKLQSAAAASGRITPVNLALGSAVTKSEITLFGDSGKSSLVGRMSDSMHTNESGREIILVTTLDEFLLEREGLHIDFLKTDTEGYDIEVLKGAESTLRRHGITFILSEYHYLLDGSRERSLGSLQEIATHLAKFSYRFVSSYTDSVHCHEEIGTYNALFVAATKDYHWNP